MKVIYVKYDCNWTRDGGLAAYCFLNNHRFFINLDCVFLVWTTWIWN